MFRFAAVWSRLGLLLISVPAYTAAQQVTIGQGHDYSGDRNPPAVETDFNLSSPASAAGQLTTATFGWSNTPCPAAAKVKFFRPTFGDHGEPELTFVTERGPFDVTAPRLLYPPIAQSVALVPPVQVEAGDIIAITNLTQCGGPTFNFYRSTPSPPTPSESFAISGDVRSTVPIPSELRGSIYLFSSGNDPGSLFLLGRFQVTLLATNPRTGRTTEGTPVSLNDAAGYFSLPEFTGDAGFPEVMVKMADATAIPSLGGTFWFFHAPLTDVRYTLRVKDNFTAAERTYSAGDAGPGQLCGAVDTSAFPGS